MPVPKHKENDFEEKTVKCSLRKRVLVPGLSELINLWVEDVSRADNRGSLVFSKFLIHCLQNKLPLPNLNEPLIYRQCYNVGVGKPRKMTPYLKEVYEEYFKDFPIIVKKRSDPMYRGVKCPYDYNADTYATNFSNYLVFSFKKRQQYHVKNWCAENNVPEYYKVLYVINGWSDQEEPKKVPTARSLYLKEIRKNYPKLPTSQVTKDTAKMWEALSKEEKARWEPVETRVRNFIREQRELLGNPEKVNILWLKKNLNTLVKYYWAIEPSCTKKHLVAPIRKVKRHSIVICNTSLKEMLRNLEYDKPIVWSEVFKLPNNKKEWKNYLTTDGVSVSFHYKNAKFSTCASQPPTNVVAIDPGRVNLMYAVRDDGKIFNLTKGEYYTKGGINKCKKKTKGWESKIEYGTLNSFSLKNPDDWEGYLKEYIRIYHSLWKSKIALKWSRESFRVYTLKNSVRDKYFDSLCVYDGVRKPITVAYGAAKFNPTGKHELSSPTTSLSKRCSSHHRTIFIDEFRTSITCNKCGGALDTCKKQAINKNGKSYQREIRGFKWCSTKCLRPINRDENAAKNILDCYPAVTRPLQFCRDGGKLVTGTKYLLTNHKACETSLNVEVTL